jgi:hypothetical protein
MSRTFLVGYLLDLLRAGVGDNTTTDLAMKWVEDCYSFIKDQPWPWNWVPKRVLTADPKTEAGCTWVKGDSYITTAAPVSIGLNAAGLVVDIGRVRYRVSDAGHANPNRIYLGSPLLGDQPTGKSLTFYQDRFFLKTTMVKCVDTVGDRRLRLMDKDVSVLPNTGKRWREVSPSRPSFYIVHDQVKLEPPKFPPMVSASGVGPFTQGKYIYFYTLYEEVSGLESAPGPQILWNNTTTNRPNVIYGNPVGNLSEAGSWKLRLYRSELNPTSDRCAMFLVQERDPTAPALPFPDADEGGGRFYTKKRFWDGALTAIEPYPIPLSQTMFEVEQIDSHYYRLSVHDRIDVGRNMSVQEAFEMHMRSRTALASRDDNAHYAAVKRFRQQVMYLLSQEKSAGHGDIALHEHIVHDPNASDGDWVERLQAPTAWDF